MSDAFGPLNFSGAKQEVFLGRDFNQNSTHSEDTSQRIDAEIRRIVTSEYERALKILTEHRKELEQIAEALLEYETLDGDDIDTLLRGGKLERPVAAVARKQAATAAAAESEDSRKRPGIIPPKPTPEPA